MEKTASNNLVICEQINKKKEAISKEELGPAISSHMAEVGMKYRCEESTNCVVVNNVLEGLKISGDCSGINIPILNEAVA